MDILQFGFFDVMRVVQCGQKRKAQDASCDRDGRVVSRPRSDETLVGEVRSDGIMEESTAKIKENKSQLDWSSILDAELMKLSCLPVFVIETEGQARAAKLYIANRLRSLGGPLLSFDACTASSSDAVAEKRESTLTGGDYSLLKSSRRRRRILEGITKIGHVRKALDALHPRLDKSVFDENLRRVYESNQKRGALAVMKFRAKTIRVLKEVYALSNTVAAYERKQLHPVVRGVHERRGDNGETDGPNKPLDFNLTLWDEFLDWMDYPDATFLKEGMKTGFPVTGQLPLSGMWPLMAESSQSPETLESLENKQEALWVEAERRSSKGSDPEKDEWLWTESMKEVKRGVAVGPFTSLEAVRDYLVAEENSVSCPRSKEFIAKYPNMLLPGPRFVNVALRPKVTKREDGAEEVAYFLKNRAIDDLSQGANLCYHQRERMMLPSAWDVSMQIKLCREIFGSDAKLSMGAVDEEKAYRTLPVMIPHRRLMITVQRDPFWNRGSGDQRIKFFVLSSHCFGASIAPHCYNRKSLALRSLLQCLGIASLNFFDDFWFVEPHLYGTSAEDVFKQLGVSLGINWHPDKDQKSGTEQTLLGVRFQSEQMLMGITDPKRKIRIDELEKILEKKSISRKQAESIHGKLIWFAPLMRHPLLVKRWLGAIKSRIYNKFSKSWSADLEECISHLIGAYRNAEQLPISMHDPEDAIVLAMYTDATGKRETGGCLFRKECAKALAWRDFVSDEIFGKWEKRLGSHNIQNLELQALLQSLEKFAPLFNHLSEYGSKKIYLWVFLDNESAFGNVCRLSASSKDTEEIVFQIAEKLDALNVVPWFEWLKSEENIADVPSREVGFIAEMESILGVGVVDWEASADVKFFDVPQV